MCLSVFALRALFVILRIDGFFCFSQRQRPVIMCVHILLTNLQRNAISEKEEEKKGLSKTSTHKHTSEVKKLDD